MILWEEHCFPDILRMHRPVAVSHTTACNFSYSASLSPPQPRAIRSAIEAALEQRRQGIAPLNEACITSLYADTILPQLLQLYRDAIAEWHTQRANQDLIAEMQAFPVTFASCRSAALKASMPTTAAWSRSSRRPPSSNRRGWSWRGPCRS